MIVIEASRSSSTAKVKWEGPLKPFPPTWVRIVSGLPATVTWVSVNVACLPISSFSLQERIRSGPRNSRPQSFT